MLIAQDVLDRLSSGFYIPEHVYLWYTTDVDTHLSVKDNMDKLDGCRVCAFGACLVSAISFANQLTFGDISNSVQEGYDLMQSIFSKSQLFLIETAYEANNCGRRQAERSKTGRNLGKLRLFLNKISFQTYGAYKFGEQIEDDTARMRAIMQNIIVNTGTFIP